MKATARISFLCLFVLQAWSCGEQPHSPAVIIPQPAGIAATDGTFRLGAKTAVRSNLAPEDAARLWPEDLPGDIAADMEAGAAGSVHLTLVGGGSPAPGAGAWDSEVPDSYRTEITPGRVNITANAVEGLFYGIQSLRQLYDIYGRNIPCAVISDAPRFRNRALLLDVSRHYMPLDFIKKQLDMMAYLKMNRFVWYLAGDGGWRLEIDGYPQLTGNTAWRPEADYGQWKESGGGFCRQDAPGAYGGTYTEEDVREIVEYARRRFIRVVPALDLPCAHRGIASAIGLECKTGTEDRRAETEMMENILSSVTELFNPEFIYLGNGQADRARGAFCLECQPRIEKGRTGDILDSEHAYVLYIAEGLLRRNGVRLMTWDESLRGVLSHDAAVVVWNKVEEGLAAAEMGYDVMLSPSAYGSLDYYQGDPARSPRSSPGFLPLGKLYNYDPVPFDFPADGGEHVLGIQANLWTPYILSGKEAERMLYPRLLAVAETGWTRPERKSYADFRRRAEKIAKILRKKGYICFSLRRTEDNRPEYGEPVKHLAWGKPVWYNSPADRQFPGSGDRTLTDGQRGGWSFDDGRWQGFRRGDFDVTVDLGAPTDIRSISADFMQDYAAHIWLPSRVDIYASDDGADFRLLGTAENRIPEEAKTFTIASFGWKGRDAVRYIRYTAVGNGRTGAWLFTYEIIVHCTACQALQIYENAVVAGVRVIHPPCNARTAAIFPDLNNIFQPL